jgi:hypothetical protein
MWVFYKIFPMANPDFDHLYRDVRLWWLEIDAEQLPTRELGFDAQGELIVAAPIGPNYGFWTDSGEPIESGDYQEIEATDFEKVWEEFNGNYTAERSAT